MSLTQWIQEARDRGASDLHLEAGLPRTLRIGGRLERVGSPVARQALEQALFDTMRADDRQILQAQRSVDYGRTIAGVRCRINAFHTARGLGAAVRLLARFHQTLESLNLHPDLGNLASQRHGLVLVSGPTGSGKSSTIAALVDQINRSRAAHIVTLEHPIEVLHRPQVSLIRQREVGRDTPSFDQGLLDVLREDPDVIVVGEMREPETMRLVLHAAETGHLVFTTVHSGTASEALSRIIGSFPAEARDSVQASLAEALRAVVCQHLTWRPDLGIRLPELEILMATDAVRSSVRQGALRRIGTILDTGAADGSWSRERYRRWLDGRERFVRPADAPPTQDAPERVEAPQAPAAAPRLQPSSAPDTTAGAPKSTDGVIDLDADGATDLQSILDEL